MKGKLKAEHLVFRLILKKKKKLTRKLPVLIFLQWEILFTECWKCSKSKIEFSTKTVISMKAEVMSTFFTTVSS